MIIKYNDNTLNLPDGTSHEEACEALKTIFPEVGNAEVTEIEGGLEFSVKAGTKGADSLTVVYGDNTLSMPEPTTTEEAREALKSIFPEVGNAVAERSGDTLTFTVKAGTKGF